MKVRTRHSERNHGQRQLLVSQVSVAILDCICSWVGLKVVGRADMESWAMGRIGGALTGEGSGPVRPMCLPEPWRCA